MSLDPFYVPVILAAAIGGGVFGDHCSPISDTTILSSMASNKESLELFLGVRFVKFNVGMKEVIYLETLIEGDCP